MVSLETVGLPVREVLAVYLPPAFDLALAKDFALGRSHLVVLSGWSAGYPAGPLDFAYSAEPAQAPVGFALVPAVLSHLFEQG